LAGQKLVVELLVLDLDVFREEVSVGLTFLNAVRTKNVVAAWQQHKIQHRLACVQVLGMT